MGKKNYMVENMHFMVNMLRPNVFKNLIQQSHHYNINITMANLKLQTSRKYMILHILTSC